VDKAKEDEAKFNTQSEAYKAKVEDLRKKLAEANENCALAKASQEISEWWKTKLEGVIEWISGEAEAFKEILSDRGDICAFSGVRGIAAILEKAGCDHVKATAQAEAAFSIDDTKDPSAEATLVGGKFYSDVWVNGG
jgi:hypothetical protein